jgi:hypothetical protein
MLVCGLTRCTGNYLIFRTAFLDTAHERQPSHRTLPYMIFKKRTYYSLTIVTALSLTACATPADQAPPSSPPLENQTPPPSQPTVEPVIQIVRDPELERRVIDLELQLMERDARIASLESRLEQALQEVVIAMRKLRSLATRAEAASAMAETDVALQSIGDSGSDSPELKQASRLMQRSSEEFKRSNFGGALFLANQAKAVARLHGVGGEVGNLRRGEVPFAGPVRLNPRKRSNVREGPGTRFAVSFTAEAGTVLSGLSYLEGWIRVFDDAGNEGWIFAPLVIQ